MVVDKSELEDFYTVLRERGLPKADFEVRSAEYPFPTVGISAVTGTITVRNKKTGPEQTYEAGHGSIWIMQFAKDLDAGYFA